MSLFSYEAIDRTGRRRRGEIEAASEREARKRLKQQGLVPRALAASQQAKAHAAAGRGKLAADELVAFLQQLAALLEAGMPLAEALDAIATGMEAKRSRRLVASLRQRVLEGGSLAQAMAEQHFDAIVCNMVAAGEETGQLTKVAQRLAELLEQRQRFKQDLLSITLYPLIVTGFGLLVMLFLLAVVVPQVARVFARAGSDLPWLTQALIALSEAIRLHGWLLLLLFAALIPLYRVAMRQQRLRHARDRLLLGLPGLGAILTKTEIARFCRTLGMLLAGGVPALAAVHIAAQSLSMLPMRVMAVAAEEALREGGSFSEHMAQSPYMPHLAVRLLAVGEQSGALDTMLLKVADHYEVETTRSLKRLVTLLEPLLVLLMAVMVGAMAVAILLPIVEMNELVR